MYSCRRFVGLFILGMFFTGLFALNGSNELTNKGSHAVKEKPTSLNHDIKIKGKLTCIFSSVCHSIWNVFGMKLTIMV